MSISKFTVAVFGIIFATVAFAGRAEAQNLRVATVPWVATDLTIPHQAYNGKATIFKAIARGGNGTYQYRWDFDGNGTYDQALQSTNNRYNLGASFTYPNQATTTTFQAKIEVTSNGQTVTGIYPVRVFADVPLNPNLATDRQLQVMNSVAVDNALWYLHNRMTRTGSEEDALFGAQATGNIGENGVASAAGFLWTLSLNGHFAAFPDAYIGEMPNAAENTQRFRDDPYAEDAMRLINYIISQGHLVGVAAADEANLTGFYPEISREPIFGTDDGLGFYLGASPADETVYYIGHALSALSVARLQGYVSQVGEQTKILGRRYEYIIQQVVDAAVWHQSDAGPVGGFYYTPNSANDDLSTSLWGITGLWHADEFASAYGVIVPNLVKARLVQYVNGNQNNCPQGGTGGTYVNSDNANCDFTMSAAHTLVLGWVFANQYNTADTRLAFPGYNGITRGNLRSWYNSSLTFITNVWTSTIAGHHSWNMGFAVGGDFGRVDGAGCHYCMLHWQDAARAVEPEIVTFGANNWARQFSRYLINNQAADGGWNWQLTLGANSDNAGAAGLRAAWAVLVLSPDAIPPLAIGTSSVTTAPEGTPISFNGAASDPGTGNPVYTWAFGNGQTLPGQNVVYPYPDNGNFTVALNSTSVGGTSIDTFPVVITNVAPTANAGPAKVVNEGAVTAFDVAVTDPGTADTFTYSWNWADGTANGAIKSPNHTFADNALRNVVVTVTDDDLGSTTSTVGVTVNNVPPTITSTPPANPTATEGAQFAYNVTFTDPGTLDTFTCSKPTSPAGSTINLVGGVCQFRWTPNFAQAIGANAPVQVCVTDDDGGQVCQSFAISVSFLDADNDQLPDSWEVANFGNIAATDQFGDGDTDGMNNLQEFNNVTNPNVYDGPTAPQTQSPACGSEIATQQTSLVARNATDPQPAQAASLLYRFELYRDQALTQLVIATDNVPQGAGLTTSYPVPVSLLENARYYWRVRAKDPFTAGAWSAPVCGFLVNTANEPPNAPRINSPVFGGQATSLQPTLKVDNAVDPDEDVLTYTFEVYRDQVLSQLVTSVAGRPAGVGTTSWQVNVALTEDTTYYWRARAVDPDNVAGDWSSTGRFFVTTVNSAPEPPVIVAPQNGTLVTNLRPELIALNANDTDQDVLVYDWQLATDATFAAIVASGNDAPTGGVVSTRFLLPANLNEDSRYCWRVRADDGLLTSAYVSACFLVSAVNAAPSVPVLDTPLNNATNVSVSPSYFWAPSTDAEGAPITYDLQVIDAGGAVVQAINGVSGTTTSMPVPLQFDTTYRWRARAVDSSGAASAFSATNRFTTTFRDQDGDTLPDSWETTNFGSIVPQDQFGDPDEDGRNNRQEFTAGTDPNVYNGPGAPTTQTPVCGGVVAAQPVTLVAGNTVGAPGVALFYDFELFSDPGLTLQIAARDDVVQGAGATTSWQVPVNLTENRRYYWRVRAQDPFVFGAFSNPTCSFFVNTANEAPGAPTVIAPADGTRVGVVRPSLVIGNTTDPDENALTYQFQVYSDVGLTQLVASAVGVAPGAAGQTSWQVNVNLSEDTTYYWRARAADPSNLTGAWTPTTSLFVSAVNSAPQAPAIVAPQNATVVAVLRPELIALNAADVDQDVLVYDWQVATDNTFANIVAGANDAPTQGPISERFLLGADLAEDTSYCWRVRADDTQAVSPYSVACFLVSAVNSPPSVPVLNSPDDGALRVSATPTFAWDPATDAEGEAISYDLQLLDSNGQVLSTVPGIAGTTAQLAAPLAPETRYAWRVRALDRSGGASAYSAANGFTTGFEDADNDGLPDTWEVANFGDLSQEPSGDPDGDGRSNQQEFTAGTNPTSYDGPNAPAPLAPACDSVWPTNQVTLVATNAVSPPGAPLEYEFQLFADPGLTIPVAAIANLAEGAGTTEWAVPNVLSENTSYYWRVRARDSFTQGPFSVPACRFYVNSANEPPGAPRINSPAVGGQVNVAQPDLVVDNTTDPDGDPLTYTFAVYADPAFANQVTTVDGVGAGPGTTTWTVDVPLDEDHQYFWRSRATDSSGAIGAWSGTGTFFVTTSNAPPGAPTILLPLPDSVVPTLRPELAIVNGEDADHDVLVYDWQLATDATFTNIVASGIDVPTQSQVSTRFLLAADLTEDTRYCWRARSDDGQATSAYATACFVVSANNAPPTVPVLNNPSNNSTVAGLNPVFSWAPSSDVEGESITYNVEVLNAAGVVVQSIVGVSGTATLMPLPLAAETSYRWRARAVDRSGGQSAFSATNTFGTGFLDADNDGLPDSWEIANFGNITAQDQFGDPDGDGRPNLHEYLNNTNPNQYNGPGAPVPSSPVCGSELSALQVRLVTANAAGANLRYNFELYLDQGLSIPVASVANIAQGVGTTSWLVPNPLTENTHYYWRVKAKDAFTFGPYSSPACGFFVNTMNEAPGTPRINSPAPGGQVNLLRPRLVIDNATDPDEDTLTYTFEVYREPALTTLVASQNGVAAGANTTTWAVNTDLQEDRTYYWRARATDPDNLAGGWSATGEFFVSTTNSPPEVPTLSAPLEGAVVSVLRPEFIILDAADVDHDALVYDWQLATDTTFGNVIAGGTDQRQRVFGLAMNLTEDTHYCWRARSDDGQATSNWATACFLVSAENAPPSVPTPNNPANASKVTTFTPAFAWMPSTDPEDETITYEVEVIDADGMVVASAAGVAGNVTAMAQELDNNTEYSWHVRAVDRSGGRSEFSTAQKFTVEVLTSDATVTVGGTGCQAAGRPSTGTLILFGFGLTFLLRRRRRGDRI